MNKFKLVLVIGGTICGCMLTAASIYCYITEKVESGNQLIVGAAGTLVCAAIEACIPEWKGHKLEFKVAFGGPFQAAVALLVQRVMNLP